MKNELFWLSQLTVWGSIRKYEGRDMQKIYSEEISYISPHFGITDDRAIK